MNTHTDGSVTLTRIEWTDLKLAFKDLNRFADSGPWTYEDTICDKAGHVVAYHKSADLVAGRAYVAESWDDKDDEDEEEDDDEWDDEDDDDDDA